MPCSCLPLHWNREKEQGSQGTLTTTRILPSAQEHHPPWSYRPLNYLPVTQSDWHSAAQARGLKCGHSGAAWQGVPSAFPLWGHLSLQLMPHTQCPLQNVNHLSHVGEAQL